MGTIDIKLKSYDELVFEITKLNTDIYLKNKEIERLNNIIDKAIEYIKAGKTFENKETERTVEKLQNDLLIILEDKGEYK